MGIDYYFCCYYVMGTVTRLQNVFATLAWFSIASLMYVSYLFFSDDVEKNAEFVTIEFIVLIVVCVISCPLGIYYTKKGRKLEGDLRK